jgi:hypothetical protein
MLGSMASVESPPSLRTVLLPYEQVSTPPGFARRRADTLSEDHGKTEKGKEGSYGGEQDA